MDICILNNLNLIIIIDKQEESYDKILLTERRHGTVSLMISALTKGNLKCLKRKLSVNTFFKLNKSLKIDITTINSLINYYLYENGKSRLLENLNNINLYGFYT